MKVERSALLPYSALQMYDIVADIEAYPTFLNWCNTATVIGRAGNVVTARLSIAYSKLNMSFTTRNENAAGESIALRLVDGPFTHLAGVWTFKRLNESACKVSLEMEFHFERSAFSGIFSKAFEKIITKQLDAFQQRAEQLHGAA